MLFFLASLSRSRGAAAATASAALVALSGCGARDDLRGPTGESGYGAAGPIGPSTSGGAGGAGGNGGSGGDAPLPPKPDCSYVSDADPMILFTYPEGVRSPLMATLDPGGAASEARVAFAATHEHFWHPEIRIAELTIGADWPDGVAITQPMVAYGIDAHAPGHLVARTDVPDALALAYYHGDLASPGVTPGVMFRAMDASTWAPQGDQFVEADAGYAYGIAPGPGFEPGAGLDGRGYLVAWRGAAGMEGVESRVALVDEQGSLLISPEAIAPAGDYPGPGMDVAWSGQHYLIAVSGNTCTIPPCAHETTVFRYIVEGGGLASFDVAAIFPAQSGYKPLTPTIVSGGGAVWVAWREIEETMQPDPSQVMRLERLDPTGASTGSAFASASGAVAGPSLTASDQGALLAWGELRDAAFGPNEVGHSAIVAHAFGKAGPPLGEIEIPTTQLSFGLPYAAVAIDQPRGILLGWSGLPSSAPGPDVTYLTRLDCVEQRP